MNQRCTRHDDPLRRPSNHGVREDILCKHPADVGSIRIMIRSEEEEHQSSEEKKLALQHCGGRCTDNDDLRSSLEKELVLRRNYDVERSSSRNGYLSQHSQHSSDRMTQMPREANLAAYRVENTNTARVGQCDYSDEERYANLGVGIMSPSERRASKREQDNMYSTTNRTDQSHHNSTNVSSWQHTRKSPTDGIERNSGGGSVDGFIRRTIELSHGVYVRLRGAEETWDCIGRDLFMPCKCFGCSHELCCIQDADYVLCPKCRVVSPMDTTSYGSETTNATDADTASTTPTESEHEGGVGLGFTFDDLLKWQVEIIQGRDFWSGNGF
jgi:hypothetical protein